MSASSEPRPRAVRVFISSTFRDMQGEREELVKRVFPHLRALCELRGVTWGEVDLRWGVTDEAKAEGRVLPICLEEIRRCRPYFIGLLGERYGWVPDEINEALARREPWLRERAQRSVTELEILHGVLNDPQMAACAFFYFRDPSWVDRLPQESRAACREEALPDEIDRLGNNEAEARAARRRAQLAALKQRIRASGLPLREDYADPKELGALVREDLTRTIDAFFPPDDAPDPLTAAADEHRRFGATRRESAVARPELLARLDRHASGAGPPLVLVGPSGSGKTTLLAMWATAFRQANPGRIVIDLYAGATPETADWESLARLLAGELMWSGELQDRVRAAGDDIPRFDVRDILPRTPDGLRHFVSSTLQTATARTTVIVLDGLDVLSSPAGVPLDWLPEALPARLVVSAAPGPAAAELTRRGWEVVEIPQLGEQERRRFVTEGLARHGKALESRRIEKIACAPATSQPLFLGALIEELRVHGEYETLDAVIDRYLECRDTESLFAALLSRFERDYEDERPRLVRDALSLIRMARRGISESELLGILGSEGSPLPQAVWSPLHQTLRPHLLERRGRLSLLHEELARAVEERYLPSEDDRRRVHLQLAEYFRARGWTPRSIFETPWQLEQAGEWKALAAVLAAPSFLGPAWAEPQPAAVGQAALMAMLLPPAATSEITYADVLRYWAAVERSSSFRIVDAYRPLLASPADHPEPAIIALSRLLVATGHRKEAEDLQRWIAGAAGDPRMRANALVDQVIALADARRWDEALAKLDEAEPIYRDQHDIDGLLACSGNRAIAMQHKGNLEAALQSHRECELLARRLHNPAAIATSLSNQAWIASAQRRHDDALAHYQGAVQLAREAGDQKMTAAMLGNAGLSFRKLQRLDEAIASFDEQAKAAEEIGDSDQLASALRNAADVLHTKGRDPEAIARLKALVELGDRVRRGDFLLFGHRQRAELLVAAGSFREALTAARSARWVAAKLDLHEECDQVDTLIEAIKARAAQPPPPKKPRWRFW